MKVLYEPFLRRARPTSTNNNGSSLEICHPGEFHLPKTPNGTHDSHHLGNGNGMKSSTNGTTQRNVRHIIDYDAICIAKELGVGEFGVVQQGIWTNPEGQSIQVAVKCLSAARLENSRQEFLKEATIMHSIVHEHVVTLHGIVLEPSIMLVTELAPLRSLLECLKEPTLISHFPVMSLCVFAAQIADGMAYLESKRLIHRDLAARNILVFSKNKVKISDFGLSRALGVGKDYYQSNFNVNLKLPIAWCAPECINYLKFTSQSDVWAYGVTLWEMFSFGFQPWAALTGQQILETIDQPNYQRLEQPECCPRDYYQLMLKCWAHEPAQRPNFSEILQILPDCKPEMLQAIRSSSSNHHRNDELLAHKSGDIVTVIEKNGILDSPGQMESSVSSPYWKGVNNDRKVGYFNPSDFVTFLGMNLPSTNVPTSASNSFERNASSNGHSGPNSSHSNHHHSHSIASTISSTLSHSSKFFRGILDASKHHISGGSGSPNGSRKNGHHSSNPNHRLRTDMISKPQGDLKHTGHVGADGVFGDVPFGENSGNDKQKGASTSVKHPPQLSHPVYSHGNLYTTSSKDDDELEKADHEYQEISDEEHNNNSNSNNNNHPQHHNDHHFLPLESPSFEVLDFGPSLMDEVLGALDHHQIRPDLCHETSESEYAHNEHGINLKNEVRELNLKHCKDQNGTNASHSRKKHNSVKPITEEEENELDSAIAMAKDIASRSLMQEEYDLIPADSPKTPNSPNKRKSHFTFKFPTTHKHHNHSPKGERRTFSEETNAIGDIIESITPAAKEAYLSLIDRGVSKPEAAAPITANGHKSMTLTRPDVKPPPPPPSSQGSGHLQNALYMTPDPVDSIVDNNPLRMLRTAGIVRPKVRGNRSFSQPRIPTTAGLARVASARSQLGSPPPVPNELEEHYSQPSTIQSTMNALPLPPRDRSRPLIQLKMHQRRHPLVLPSLDINGANGLGHHQIYSNGYDAHNLYDSVRVPKQVTCPQPPAAYLNSYAAQQRNSDPFSSGQANALSHDDSGESLEDEMAKAFENIKMSTSIDMGAAPTTPKEPETNGQSHNGTSNGHSNGQSNGYSMMMAPAKNLDCDEVRVMQKVLGSDNTLTDDECYELLTSTDMDVHKAIKCVKLQQQIRSQNIAIPGCDWAKMMSKFNWNVRQASNYLIATHGVPEDTTEV